MVVRTKRLQRSMHALLSGRLAAGSLPGCLAGTRARCRSRSGRGSGKGRLNFPRNKNAVLAVRAQDNPLTPNERPEQTGPDWRFQP